MAVCLIFDLNGSLTPKYLNEKAFIDWLTTVALCQFSIVNEIRPKDVPTYLSNG